MAVEQHTRKLNGVRAERVDAGDRARDRAAPHAAVAIWATQGCVATGITVLCRVFAIQALRAPGLALTTWPGRVATEKWPQ